MNLWNYKGEQNNITEALQLRIPPHAVISLTGAGGKTSLMTAWARELASQGRHTVITTTTHLQHPLHFKDESESPYRGIPVLFPEDFTKNGSPDTEAAAEKLEELLAGHGTAMVVSADPARPKKLMQPAAEIMERVFRTADAVLIEADGSRRKPFKWPMPWEPVVSDKTDITVCVAGLSALGHPMQVAMYGTDLLPEDLRRDIVDEQLMSTVLASPDGGQKGSRGEFRVFLNQADNEALFRSACRIRQILGVYGIRSAWGSLL